MKKEELERLLRPGDRRAILKRVGFEINGQRPNGDGWINSIKGPNALGEGKHGNFSVNLETGQVKDWGATGYEGDLYQAVMDVRGLSFPEALEWIASATGHDPVPEPEKQDDTTGGAPGDNDISTEKLTEWSRRLWEGERQAAAEARRYLTEERGLDSELLRARQVGLHYKYGKPWITWPLGEATDDNPCQVVKCTAFHPSRPGWWLTDDGKKILRTEGGGSCLELMTEPDRSGPLLLTEGEIDALSAYQAGWNVATGSAGAGTFAGEWAVQIAAEEAAREGVVICYDGDRAGRKGAQNAAQKLFQAGVTVYIASPPEETDVNDLLREEGTAALQSVVDAAEPYETPGAPEVSGARSGEETGSGKHAPPIPDEVYGRLPDLLKEATSYFREDHERDVFLTGSLALLSGCMPNVQGYYGHNADRITPNFYAAIVAGAASGKGVLKWARKLVEPIDQLIRTENRRAIEQWERERERAAENDEPPPPDSEPPKRSLILPANTSASAFHRGLADRNGRAILVETEIDTLVNALGQEWGKFDDTLRKAFHHEWVSYLRNEEEVSIENPQLSTVLSGTVRQFERLVESTENGLFSRFAMFVFQGQPRWISQRPSHQAKRKIASFERLAGKVEKLFQQLRRRKNSLWFELTSDQWKMHDRAFAELKYELQADGRGHLADVVHRAGVIAFRIAMTLRVVRGFSGNVELDRRPSVAAAPEDLEIALRLAKLYARHSIRFAIAHLAAGESTDPQSARIGTILRNTDDRFCYEDVYKIAETAGFEVSPRTLQRDMETAIERGLLRKLDRTHLEKVLDAYYEVPVH
jgi:hypothetical protein